MKEMLMGIENEFTFQTKKGSRVHAYEYFSRIRDLLNTPYFKKGDSAIRLSTGGAFYLDGDEPEITTAPYVVEKGAVSAVIANLMMTRNMIVQAIEDVNMTMPFRTPDPLYLQGYSAHYNFSFPEMGECVEQASICRLLAKTVNPAIHLLTESHMSHGIMFRDREGGRFEICADYIPGVDDLTAAMGFQTAMFSTIRSWVASGMNSREMKRKMQYDVCVEPYPVSSRYGYIADLSDVLDYGRDAVVKVRDGSGHVLKKTAQELLLHYAGLFEEGMDKFLTKEEKNLVMDSVHQKRDLPIDGRGFPLGYDHVNWVGVDKSLANAPLKNAFSNAVLSRIISQDFMLAANSMEWETIVYDVFIKPKPNFDFLYVRGKGIPVSLDYLVPFETLLEKNPTLFRKIMLGNLNPEDKQLFVGMGFDNELIGQWDMSSALEECEMNYGFRFDESASSASTMNFNLENVVVRHIDDAARRLESLIASRILDHSEPCDDPAGACSTGATEIQSDAEDLIGSVLLENHRSPYSSWNLSEIILPVSQISSELEGVSRNQAGSRRRRGDSQ